MWKVTRYTWCIGRAKQDVDASARDAGSPGVLQIFHLHYLLPLTANATAAVVDGSRGWQAEVEAGIAGNPSAPNSSAQHPAPAAPVAPAKSYAERQFHKYLAKLLERRASFGMGPNLATIKARQDAFGVR